VSAEIRPTHRPLRVPGRRLVVTKNMVETAIANTRSNAEAARWLGITPVTYKKWAGYYGLYEQHKNQAGKGIKKGYGSYRVPLEDIFEGKRKNPYPYSILKRRMLSEGYMQEECAICGWDERNIVTGKICLTIDFVDGNHESKNLDNMRLLCPNCYYSNNGKFSQSRTFCK
tara:strand:+ start:285 stop:797 length:513 start_codon:yes stop_codon:yes gene_type:complete